MQLIQYADILSDAGKIQILQITDSNLLLFKATFKNNQILKSL